MTVHHISLADCLEGVFPPAKTLTVAAVDDTAFVYINAVTQNGKSETQTVTAEIAVSLASLREALLMLGNDRNREDLRPTETGVASRPGSVASGPLPRRCRATP
ncbi:hypothetical protein [Streptomyces sp. NPDC127040]|uniref:hypothetical protein n=1 Tax=Streptomyces sp. NPDC127040 TaxID=3347116 RepID=UPI00364891FC